MYSAAFSISEISQIDNSRIIGFLPINLYDTIYGDMVIFSYGIGNIVIGLSNKPNYGILLEGNVLYI